MHRSPLVIGLCVITSLAFATLLRADEDWIPLFDGKDLEGWGPIFAGPPLDVSHRDTFRVEDGLLKASYENYERFDGAFRNIEILPLDE